MTKENSKVTIQQQLVDGGIMYAVTVARNGESLTFPPVPRDSAATLVNILQDTFDAVAKIGTDVEYLYPDQEMVT